MGKKNFFNNNKKNSVSVKDGVEILTDWKCVTVTRALSLTALSVSLCHFQTQNE